MIRPKVAGAYLITHVKTGKFYAGSTDDLPSRMVKHKGALRRKEHRNKPLQIAYNDDVNLEFKFYITEDRESAFDVEQELIDKYKSSGKLFNVSMNARNPAVFTKESRQKGSLALIGFKHSLETRRNMSNAAKGKIISEETKQKMRYASPAAKAVSIDDVEYYSISEASRALKISHRAMRSRIYHSTLFLKWRFLN